MLNRYWLGEGLAYVWCIAGLLTSVSQTGAADHTINIDTTLGAPRKCLDTLKTFMPSERC